MYEFILNTKASQSDFLLGRGSRTGLPDCFCNRCYTGPALGLCPVPGRREEAVHPCAGDWTKNRPACRRVVAEK